MTTKENAFPAPNGDILQMWMQDGSRYLQKIAPEDGDLLDMSKTGRPELYWADFGVYGSLSTIIVVMMWLYFCMYLLLVGAHINRFAVPFRREILEK